MTTNREARGHRCGAAAPTFLDAQRATLQELQQASLIWWETRRPIHWDLRQHLDNPVVNTTTPAERRLAEAVAAAVERGSV